MKEPESCSGDQKPGSEAKENELKARDKYFEEMHPPGNINSQDLSQETETHSAISTKNKPPSRPFLKQLLQKCLKRSVKSLDRGDEKADRQETEGEIQESGKGFQAFNQRKG